MMSSYKVKIPRQKDLGKNKTILPLLKIKKLLSKKIRIRYSILIRVSPKENRIHSSFQNKAALKVTTATILARNKSIIL